MKMKIRRRCKCGCGGITSPGKKYIRGHNGKDRSEETRKKLSIAAMGNTSGRGKQSKETILKRSISRTKCHPNDPYCDIWRSTEYKSDLRKDYCENKNCKRNYKRLNNHHIDLNKKNCHPSNVMTLCASCHSSLHRKLQDGKQIAVNPKDFLVINRPDHVIYIDKKTRRKIIIKRRYNIKYDKTKKCR